ncbi:MAG TPA: type II CAAX endopeptidase family protein [Ignavibacteria bacterium]|nr:type II CAAX endopeptidase family protein [Ignavibacteria bacterium]HRF67555.1 type II CAAX endopeptidase family protein [Ignavibacteria bacterium]HRJ05359.1 type II CAAX endopeptidase family protein [Ignavibacteria bacterium]
MTEITSTESGIKKRFALIIIGYILLYGTFELTAKLTGDTVNPLNALLISVCVFIAAVIVEVVFFKSRFSELVKILGLGKPGSKALIASLVITLLLFLCYPLITLITGFNFNIPENWIWLAIGVFVLHGIAEEVLYRGFLFRRLRESRSFWKAAWLAVIFFTVAHIPIIINQGLLVGGMAVLLAVISSFPFSYLYEKGNNSIWAPAIVHAAIDTIIPILAAGPMDERATMAVTLWMAASMAIPYLSFVILKSKKA